MATKLLKLMTELTSRKWISKLMGKFSHSKISRLFIPTFVKTYNIPVHEAEKEIGEYRSLNDFFTRRLQPGMRPIHAGFGTIISPVDSMITAMGDIEEGTILNVKGQDYTLTELLANSPRVETYKNGFAFVLYLSPTDYHRIHAPVSGNKLESEHLKGKVYPVNHFGMTHMKAVLSRNERLITYIAHEFGEVAVVKVGAMNVSSIKYTDDSAQSWNQGDDLAYFEFGSTVVLIMENNTFIPRTDLQVGSKVKMGELLGLCTRATEKDSSTPETLHPIYVH